MLRLPPVYPITDATRPDALAEQVRRFGEAGFPLVQFRGKPLDLASQWRELRQALEASRENGDWPMICINDRADLAVLAAQQGLTPWGLHLGQDDLPPGAARALPGLSGVHLGTSTHSPGEWEQPDPACDHAGVGPVKGTATKSDHAPPIGLEGLAAGCHALRTRGVAPIAIGGLAREDALACFRAGAESLAMVGEVHRALEPSALGWELQRQRWRARPPFRRGQGIVILGGSGMGKTTLGRKLAFGLALPFHDLDEVIAVEAGMSVAEIFARQGEPAFRDLEGRLLQPLLGSPSVVALGGGAWQDPGLRAAVAASGFAALWVADSPARAWARVGQDPSRPLAQDHATFMARYRSRLGAWAEADMLLAFGHSSRELAEALLD